MQPYPSNLKLILHFLSDSRRYFILSMFFAGVVSLLDMVNPKIISFTVDCVIGTKPVSLPEGAARLLASAGGVDALRSRPALIAAAVLGVGVLAALSRYIFRLMNSWGAETFVRKMRDDLFSHIMYLPYAWHGENSTGDIIQRCTSDVQTIKRFISEQLVQLFRTVIMIGMALFFMGRIHFRVMLGAAVMIPVIVIYSLVFHVKIGAAFEKVDEEESLLSTIVQENLTGVRVVRAFGREVYERSRFERQNSYYTGFWIRLMTIASAYWSVADILTGLQILLILLFGSAACIRGTLTAGGFIAMTSYNLMLVWPVRQLGRVISEMSKAGISIERLRYIMNSRPETDLEGALEPPMDRDIVFDHVSFSYSNANINTNAGSSSSGNNANANAGVNTSILSTGNNTNANAGANSNTPSVGNNANAHAGANSNTPSAGNAETAHEDVNTNNSSSKIRTNVGAAPNPGRFIINDLSLTIPAGTTLGILGGTGSGKSTLMYLLERLYELSPGNGRITIGGVDIADIRKEHLRRNIGMVLQEPFLFSRTLAENIGIAAKAEDEKDREEIRRAAQIAGIDDTIESFTAGYDTFVGERGVTLSGGQKQRTAIAQMLMRKTPIMIFDDSLSAVDAETDMKIRHALRENIGSATVIMIGHRITTLMNADRIIVLDKGRIREQGTHEELLAMGGLYRRIYDLQTAGTEA